MLSFCQLKLLLPLFGSYWAFFGPNGTRNSFGDLKMMSNGPTHLYRQLSFSESAPIHAYKSISKACWGQTDRPTEQPSYRSDFSSLKKWIAIMLKKAIHHVIWIVHTIVTILHKEIGNCFSVYTCLYNNSTNTPTVASTNPKILN